MNVGLILAGMIVASPAHANVMKVHDLRVAVTCFKKGEEVSGMNKICYYNCLGSDVAITIGAVSLCPLTIDR